jgi:hypothetical protein
MQKWWRELNRMAKPYGYAIDHRLSRERKHLHLLGPAKPVIAAKTPRVFKVGIYKTESKIRKNLREAGFRLKGKALRRKR